MRRRCRPRGRRGRGRTSAESARASAPHASSTRPAVERLDDRREGALDLLAAERALRRQLPLRVEVAVEQREAHDALVRREVAVHRGHDLAEVGVARPPAVAPASTGSPRSGTISRTLWSRPSPTRKARLTPGTSVEALLDGGGRDRLAAGVLVDVLDAVDDLEVAARPPHEDVAGRQPVLLARARSRAGSSR